jgi:hypothetical protein
MKEGKKEGRKEGTTYRHKHDIGLNYIFSD